LRDRSMASTVDEILRRFGRATKVMLWAHNGHLVRTVEKRADWIPMGVHLTNKFRAQYYAIAQCFLKGSFSAADGDNGSEADSEDVTKWKQFTVDAPEFKSIETTFAKANIGDFYIDFRSAPTGTIVQKWLKQYHPLRGCATWFLDSGKLEWMDYVSPSLYDGMTFIRSTKAAASLKCDDAAAQSK